MTSQQEGQSGTPPDHRGFVINWRKIDQWQWYTYPGAAHLFQHLIRSASHRDKFSRGVEEKRGQLITGLHRLSEETGLSVQNIRTLFKKLESTNDIIVEATSKFTRITICNYLHYQNENERSNKQLTNNQQTTNKQLTTPNNDNNDNKKKKHKAFDVIAFRPEWITEDDWKAIVQHRRKHKAKPAETERAYKSIIKQLDLARNNGHTVTECVDKWTNRGWQGFEASWMNEKQGGQHGQKESSKVASARYLLQQRLEESGDG